MSKDNRGHVNGLKTWNAIAYVSLAFCVVVTVVLGWVSLRSRQYDPLATAKMDELLLALNRSPKDETLRAQVHQLDLKIRKTYFQKQAFAVHGFYMLIGGVLVFFAASEVIRSLRKSLPTPNPKAVELSYNTSLAGRRSVAVLGLFLGGGLVTLAALSRHDAAAEYAKAATRPVKVTQEADPTKIPSPNNSGLAPLSPDGLQATPNGAITSAGAIPPTGGGKLSPNSPTTNITAIGPSNNGTPTKMHPAPGMSSLLLTALVPEALKNDWYGFRGPGGVGIALASSAPTSWSSTKNVIWKTPVSLPGWNSPIVVGGKLFYAEADKTNREVVCLDAGTGAPVWKNSVSSSTKKQPQVMEDTGYAPSTMASDGQRVFAMFPNGDVVCFDLAGHQVWRRDLGMPENVYGHASSLVVYGTGLIIQMDQGMSAEDGKSKLMALEASTGKPVWEVKRQVGGSWSTPVFVKVGQKDVLVTAANPLVVAYDPSSGTELWRASCLSGDVSVSPAFGAGLVFVANTGSNLSALVPNLTGDITKSGIAWTSNQDVPDIASLLCENNLLYMLTSEGTLTCLDAKTGKKVYNHSYHQRFNASPIFVAGKVYITEISGKTHILDGGRSFKEIATPNIGEEIRATPAFVSGRVYLRSKQHIFCIGDK